MRCLFPRRRRRNTVYFMSYLLDFHALNWSELTAAIAVAPSVVPHDAGCADGVWERGLAEIRSGIIAEDGMVVVSWIVCSHDVLIGSLPHNAGGWGWFVEEALPDFERRLGIPEFAKHVMGRKVAGLMSSGFCSLGGLLASELSILQGLEVIPDAKSDEIEEYDEDLWSIISGIKAAGTDVVTIFG